VRKPLSCLQCVLALTMMTFLGRFGAVIWLIEGEVELGILRK